MYKKIEQNQNTNQQPQRQLRPENAGKPLENKIAWAAAVGVHVVLALLFAFIKVGWREDIAEWV